MSASEFGLSFKSFVAKGIAAQDAADKEIAKHKSLLTSSPTKFVVRRQGKYLSRRCVWLKSFESANRWPSAEEARRFCETFGMDFPDLEIVLITDKH